MPEVPDHVMGERTNILSAVAYISLLVPATAEYDNPALHRTGNSFMLNFLRQLSTAFPDTTSLSAAPVPSFPGHRQLWFSGSTQPLGDGLTTTLVPFINITPLKQLMIGAGICVRLIKWAGSRVGGNKLVFLYNTTVPHVAFVLLASRATKTPVVAFIGDVNVPGQTAPKSAWHRVDFWLQKRLIRRLDGFIVVADRIAGDFAPNRRFLRLDAALDRDVVAITGGLLAEASQAQPTTTTIVHSGGLVEHNGTTDILKAFALIPDPSLRLRIAGRGPLSDAVVAAAANDPRIEFLGYLPYDQLLAVHAAADVLISFRVTKGVETGYAFPSKTMEYLCSGVPVITTRTGHMESEYSDYCYLVDHESAAGLAETIQRVLQEPPGERRRRALAAREYVVATKTWDAQGARVRLYLESVVSEFLVRQSRG